MQLSYSWLTDFIKIPKKITPEEIGRRLSLHTVEVEKVISEADKFNGVIVGRILEVKKHPNADRLQLAKVKIGKDLIRDIVCGAPNIAPGQLVPVALPGTILPNGAEIKEAEVRGVKSEGMLCAPDELGLGEDHAGILILNKNAKIGEEFSKYLGLNDRIFEVDNKSLSNRPDLWGHYGMAREISAIFNLKLKPIDEIAGPAPSLPAKSAGFIASLTGGGETDVHYNLKVEVDDKKLCPRYMAIAMSGIKIAESPEWMKKRLSAAGMRPINNIVDITNYVMLELGQPLHAFDAELICGQKKKECRITVRTAKDGEIIESLDGEQRKLDKDMLLITDGEKPLAIAGVMGGASSEISEKTESIIIESANFDAVSVRKTSGKLALRTESSMRFEKSLDQNLCEAALRRAVNLITEVCPEAHVSSEFGEAGGPAAIQAPMEIEASWVMKKIGDKIPLREIIRILSSLGFTVEHAGQKLSIVIPSWRATKDISIPEDIAEEIIRIYGYEKLTATMPKLELAAPEMNEERKLERRIKNILAGGPALTETYNYSFAGEAELEKLNIDYSYFIRLLNPIASNMPMLRQSLAPGLLNNIRSNQAKFEEIKMFEIGSVFMPAQSNIYKDISKKEFLPYQEKRLGVVLGGENGRGLFVKMKGIAEYLLNSLKLPIIFNEIENKQPWYDAKLAAKIITGGKEIGRIAKLDSRLGKKYGLKKEAVIMEIGLAELLSLLKKTADVYSPVDKFPPAVRDLAFVVDSRISYNDINNEIKNFNSLIKEVELFDIFEGDKIGKDKKSLAFHIAYQAQDRTLTSEEVDELQKGLVKRMEEKFEAKLRNF